MLSTVCIVISLSIIVLALSQGAFAFVYASLLFRSHRRKSTGYQPKAAVVLAVRGSDPFLVANMQALLDQDYPDFKLFIIVDSEQDAAGPMCERYRRSRPSGLKPECCRIICELAV